MYYMYCRGKLRPPRLTDAEPRTLRRRCGAGLEGGRTLPFPADRWPPENESLAPGQARVLSGARRDPITSEGSRRPPGGRVTGTWAAAPKSCGRDITKQGPLGLSFEILEDAMRTADVDHACRLYGLTLTERERDLLTAPQPEMLLPPLDRLERYVLIRSLEPVQCPACGYITCRRAAAVDWDTDAQAEHPDDGYLCRNCRAGLTWNLGMRGGQWFTLTASSVSGRG